MNALTTFRRLIARCCFWPFEVRIVSRRIAASAVEVEVLEQLADRLRAHAAAEVHAEAVRRAEAVLELAEELLVVDDHLRLEVLEQQPRLLEPVRASRRQPRARPRGATRCRWYISRTFSAHWTIASRSSFWILPSVRRQRSLTSSRRSWASRRRRLLDVSASSPLPRSRAFSRFFMSTFFDELDVLLVRARRRRAARRRRG